MLATKRYGSSSYRPYGEEGDNNLVVSFFMDEVKNEKLTLESGRAVYEDREMVKINIPGAKESVIAPSNSFCTMPDGQQLRYNERFEEDYERWKKGQSAALVGTHLKHAPFLSKAEVSNLGALNVFTVEQLADLGGRPLQSLGPQGRKWQQQAVAWLQSAAGTRDATAEAARIAALENEIALLRASVGGQAPVVQEDNEQDEKTILKDEIERLTGRRPLGNPSIESLKRSLEDAQSKVE